VVLAQSDEEIIFEPRKKPVNRKQEVVEIDDTVDVAPSA
jgi:hypothetical protein